MKIAVIGATGSTGQVFVQQAAAHGHHLTVLARNPQKLAFQHQFLTVVTGDPLVYEDVKRVVQGQEAVLIALGGGMAETVPVRTEGTRQVLQSITALSETPHLVVISSLGANESAEQIPPANRAMIRQFLGKALADHDAQETLVRESTLPWTILRPAGLNHEIGGMSLRVTLPPEPVDLSSTISRADVAAFALQVIESRTHVRQAVSLSAH